MVFGYEESEICRGGKGQVLAPWPNRLADGRYSFEGTSGVAALDEPEHHNAIHGLVRWLGFEPVRLEDHHVTLSVEVMPQPAYPWRLYLELSYELPSESSLEVAVRAESRSPQPAPFGIGFHPYLAPGATSVDACVLSFVASEHLLLDERGLPSGVEKVAGSIHDFSSGRPLEGRRLDDCYSGLPTGDDGRWDATLRRGDGHSVVLRAAREFAYLMCFTADTLSEDERRGGLALEPMTCPPNALRTGSDLVVLEEGASWTGSFSLELVP